MPTPEELIKKAAALLEQARELNARQLSRDELNAMTPEQVNEARRNGRLTDLLTPAPDPYDPNMTRERRDMLRRNHTPTPNGN